MNWFVKAPNVIRLFQNDMKKHGQMFVGMIEIVVNLLRDLRKLIPKLLELEQRHIKYGAKPIDFKTLKETFVDTIREILHQEFANESEIAWNTTFDMISGIMLAVMIDAKKQDAETQFLIKYT
jgi:hemoglobin-like flavoprotein